MLGVVTILGVVLLGGCGGRLPEPESEGAKMYVRFCDNKGCHAAIPPKRGGVRYWDVQMERKMKMMRQKGLALPDAEQRRLILDYLHRNAYSSEKK